MIERISNIIKLNVEETKKYSKKIDDNLTYYWNPERGGVSLIVDNDGNYLAAVSSVNFDKLLDEFKKGTNNKNLFND